MTESDNVSPLIWKTTAVKKLELFDGVLKLGVIYDTKQDVIHACLRYTVMLYGQEPDISLKEIRASVIRRKTAGKRHVAPKLCILPPTASSFEDHFVPVIRCGRPPVYRRHRILTHWTTGGRQMVGCTPAVPAEAEK